MFVLWGRNKYYYYANNKIYISDIHTPPEVSKKEPAYIAIISHDVKRELLERVKRTEEIESRLMQKHVFRQGQIVTYEKSKNDIYTVYILPEEIFADIKDTIPRPVKIYPYEALLKRFLKKENKNIVWLETYDETITENTTIYLTIVYDNGEGVSSTLIINQPSEIRRYIDSTIRKIKLSSQYTILSNSQTLINYLRKEGIVSEQESGVLPFEAPFIECLQKYTSVQPIPPEFRSPEEVIKKKAALRRIKALIMLVIGGILITFGIGLTIYTQQQKYRLARQVREQKKEVDKLKTKLINEFAQKYPSLIKSEDIHKKIKLSRAIIRYLKKRNDLEIRKLEITGPPKYELHLYLIVHKAVSVADIKKIFPLPNIKIQSAIIDTKPGYHIIL